MSSQEYSESMKKRMEHIKKLFDEAILKRTERTDRYMPFKIQEGEPMVLAYSNDENKKSLFKFVVTGYLRDLNTEEVPDAKLGEYYECEEAFKAVDKELERSYVKHDIADNKAMLLANHFLIDYINVEVDAKFLGQLDEKKLADLYCEALNENSVIKANNNTKLALCGEALKRYAENGKIDALDYNKIIKNGKKLLDEEGEKNADFASYFKENKERAERVEQGKEKQVTNSAASKMQTPQRSMPARTRD